MMYPTVAFLQPRREPKDKKSDQTQLQYQYCSQDFLPFNRFKIYVEDESQLKLEKDIEFLLVENYQAINSFTTISEYNLKQFVIET